MPFLNHFVIVVYIRKQLVHLNLKINQLRLQEIALYLRVFQKSFPGGGGSMLLINNV